MNLRAGRRLKQQFLLQAKVFKSITVDLFPPPHAKQNLQITPGLCHVLHRTHMQAAPCKTVGDYRSTLRQHLVVGLTRHQAKPVGREHIRQANTQAAGYNGRSQRRIHLQKPQNCCCLLLHKKEVLHFYINPEIKWRRIQLDGTEQLRQWMKHIPASTELRCSSHWQCNRGKLRPWRKIVKRQNDRCYRTSFLPSYETWAPLLSDNNKKSRA